jgi:hypothetical protein
LRCKELSQVRLSGENDLEDGRLVFIEVGEQAQFLQEIRAEILGFIDDQEHPPSGEGFFREELLERMEGLQFVLLCSAQAEGEQNPGKQGIHPAMGIGDQSGCEMVLMFCQELLQERGFSHSRHACQHDEPCLVEETVFQCRHREPMSVSPIQKIRVRQRA